MDTESYRDTTVRLSRSFYIIVWFHIALHYIDAALLFGGSGRSYEASHSARQLRIDMFPAMREMAPSYQRLYKAARAARYMGAEYTPLDLKNMYAVFETVRKCARNVLGLRTPSDIRGS
jgi:hypothetical protein